MTMRNLARTRQRHAANGGSPTINVDTRKHPPMAQTQKGALDLMIRARSHNRSRSEPGSKWIRTRHDNAKLVAVRPQSARRFRSVRVARPGSLNEIVR